MAKVLKKIFDVILIAIIAILTLYFILRIDNRIRIYEVMTGSMEDNIHAGDYILIVKQDDYKLGDVVTFTKEGYYITHRIIKIEGNNVTTKGDANNVEDATINKSSIIGKAVLIGGILNIIINYKFSIVGILLAAYLITCYFGKDHKESEEKIEETVENKDETVEEKILEQNEEKANEDLTMVKGKSTSKEKEILVEETSNIEEKAVQKKTRKKKEKVAEEASAIKEKPVKNKTGKIAEEIFAMEEKTTKKKNKGKNTKEKKD